MTKKTNAEMFVRSLRGHAGFKEGSLRRLAVRSFILAIFAMLIFASKDASALQAGALVDDPSRVISASRTRQTGNDSLREAPSSLHRTFVGFLPRSIFYDGTTQTARDLPLRAAGSHPHHARVFIRAMT